MKNKADERKDMSQGEEAAINKSGVFPCRTESGLTRPAGVCWGN